MTADDVLLEFEQSFGKLRARWNRQDWKLAAELLGQLLSSALVVAEDAVETAKYAVRTMERDSPQGLASATPSRRVRRGGRPSTNGRPLLADGQLSLEECGARVDDAAFELRAILSDPFGREAYKRLARDEREPVRLLLARGKGAIPAIKGQFARKLLVADLKLSRPRRGRPRNPPDVEAQRLLRLIERHCKDIGQPVRITYWLRKVLFKHGTTDGNSAEFEKSVKASAQRLIAERKRQATRTGN